MKISLANTTKIETALDAVNGRSGKWKITNVEQLAPFVEIAEEKLARILPKSGWIGARAHCTGHGPSAKSYGYTSASTYCTLERGSKGWFLIDAGACRVYPGTERSCQIRLTPYQTLAARLYSDKRLKSDFILPEAADIEKLEEADIDARARKLAGIT